MVQAGRKSGNVRYKYLAGLFDGEGSVAYSNKPVLRKGKKKAYPIWNIRLEVSMTHEETIRTIHQMFNRGFVVTRRPIKSWFGKKTQWRWRCSHRDALHCAKRMLPYSITKKEKLESIVKHYEIKDSRSI